MRDELAGEVLFMISLMFKHRDGLSSIVCTCNPNQTHCDQHIEPTLSSLLPSEQHPSSKHKAISKNLHHHQRNKQPSIHTPPNTRSQSRLTIHRWMNWMGADERNGRTRSDLHSCERRLRGRCSI